MCICRSAVQIRLGLLINLDNMKLILSIEEKYDKQGAVLGFCIRQTNEEERFGQVYNDFSQAEEVARLTEIAQEVEKTVNAYYSKDRGLMPIVEKKSSTEPRTV